MELILKEKDPVWIVRRLSELGLGTSIHPALALDKPHLALLGEAQEVLAWFSLLFLEEKVEQWAVLFLALLDPLPPDDAKKLAKDLGVRSRVREWVRICKDEGESVDPAAGLDVFHLPEDDPRRPLPLADRSDPLLDGTLQNIPISNDISLSISPS